MTDRYYDMNDAKLHPGDIVLLPGRAGEVFRIKGLQFPADAIIENIHPGGRLGTSTLPCSTMRRGVSNPVGGPVGWDYTYEQPDLSPAPRTEHDFGCYLRKTDLEAVLCLDHLIEVNLHAS